MPDHQRKVIRDKVAELLLDQTAAGSKVHTNHVLALPERNLPLILVYTLDESVDADSASTAPRELTRRLRLAIDGFARGVSNLDDVLDALALEIEAVMAADPFLDDTAADSMLTDTEIQIDPDGEQLIGRVGLTYEVHEDETAEDVFDVQEPES